MNSKISTVLVKRPVVDKLAFILPWGTDPGVDYSQEMILIRRRVAKLIEDGVCVRAYPTKARYRDSFYIKLNGGSTAFIQIGALQPDRQEGGIRVVVNPARFASGDASQFNAIMRRIVGRVYPILLTRPLINNVDFAVDVIGINLDDILVDYSYTQRHTTFGKRVGSGGNIESYYFGSVSSDYMTVAYDKRQERIHNAIKAIVKNKTKTENFEANAVEQIKQALSAPPKVRIEIRNKKLRGLSPAKLIMQANRFARFRFCDLRSDGEKLSKLTRLAFLAMCRQSGVKAALKAFQHSKQERKVRAFWDSRQATWWKPEPLWRQASDAVQAIGLFPKEAFEPDN